MGDVQRMLDRGMRRGGRRRRDGTSEEMIDSSDGGRGRRSTFFSGIDDNSVRLLKLVPHLILIGVRSGLLVEIDYRSLTSVNHF